MNTPLNLNTQTIAQAITKAEKRTSGEIICVVAHKASTYPHTPYIWALLATLTVTLCYLASQTSGWQAAHATSSTHPLFTLLVVQTLTFCLVFPLISLTRLRYILTPRFLKHATAHRLAHQQFLARGLHLTPTRTGVLIFVSVAERYAEIHADESIHSKVKPETWHTLLTPLLADIRAGKATHGFTTAIESCATILAKHFPAAKNEKNHIPNLIIELP